MLVLNRRVGEVIKIGEEIDITILETSGRQVRVGIQAPRSIVVLREEIYLRIQKK